MTRTLAGAGDAVERPEQDEDRAAAVRQAVATLSGVLWEMILRHERRVRGAE
jgi:hypothetical protein